MLAAGIKSAPTLSELEAHLRDEIRLQMQSGADEPAAFAAALAQIGPPAPLHAEFKKIESGYWNRSLAWTAWTLFAVSLFLPAIGPVDYGIIKGWQCAVKNFDDITLPQTWQGNGWALHVAILALLNLANLLMMAAPFLLPKCSAHSRAFMGLRVSIWGALVSVWSIGIVGVIYGNLPDGITSFVHIGAFVWVASFPLLALSILRPRFRPTEAFVLN